jgi:hypothetical protein
VKTGEGHQTKRAMNTRLLILLILATRLFAQQKATQYGQVFPDAASVHGKVIMLFGNANEQGFLKGLQVAPKKATFICDNIDAQAGKSSWVRLGINGNYSFEVTSGTWPVNETIVMCGTVSMRRQFKGEDIIDDYRFAAWGSAMAYPDLKAQIPILQQAYVDFCPPGALACDRDQKHPDPELTDLPEHSTTVRGNVVLSDCSVGGPSMSSLDVIIVPNETDEQKEFNRNSSPRGACRMTPPAGSETAEGHISRSDDSKGTYAITVSYHGHSMSAYVYGCAWNAYHEGSITSCSDRTTSGKTGFKNAVTLHPNVDGHADMYFDWSAP